jgi:hypothetical protein
LTSNSKDYKEKFADTFFCDALIDHMKKCVKTIETQDISECKKYQQMLELCICLIRNIVSIKSIVKPENKQTVISEYKKSIQNKLFTIFAKSGGIFDSLVYISRNFKALHLQTMLLNFLQIFYEIFSSFPAGFIFSEDMESEYFKEMKDRQKALHRKRINGLSTRHSRFGATIVVKRDIIG